ncbi:hypothetical protein [Lysobacter gummosus]|uniref:hypothetical protein n=1 Tax=Lysobacter gummosus TaxID=262324 RepID=UPI003640C5AD
MPGRNPDGLIPASALRGCGRGLGPDCFPIRSRRPEPKASGPKPSHNRPGRFVLAAQTTSMPPAP